MKRSDGMDMNPLQWDLRREQKVRVWHKFWDGFFQELKNEYLDQPGHPVHKMIERHEFQKHQVSDVGYPKIMRWYHCHNERVLWARGKMLNEIEGLELYSNSLLCDLVAP